MPQGVEHTSPDQTTSPPPVPALRGQGELVLPGPCRKGPHTFAWTMFLPLLAAVLAAAFFAAYAHSHPAGGERFEQTLVVAGLVFGTSLLTGWGVRSTCQK